MISISIKSNSMVIPSEPTPSGQLQLSEIDQAAQWTHALVIHIYKPNNNIPSSFKKMKNALSHALVHFYPLTSWLRWKEGDWLELDCNAVECKYWKLMLTQNWMILVILCLLDDEIPFLDRTMLKSSELLMKPCFDHIAYTTKSPLMIGSLDAKEEQMEEISVALLKFTREQGEGLKNRANNETPYQENGVSTIRPYSRYEAISGHMWRLLITSGDFVVYAMQSKRGFISSSLDFNAVRSRIGISSSSKSHPRANFSHELMKLVTDRPSTMIMVMTPNFL
uniref:Uncharacterized protein n=1 Tax=Quercus lobata TaxID=97700 RepID=A0A7N2R1M2_QUELO